MNASAEQPSTPDEVHERMVVLPGGSSLLEERSAALGAAARATAAEQRPPVRRQSEIDSTMFGSKTDERSGRPRRLSITEHPFDPTAAQFDAERSASRVGGAAGLSSLPDPGESSQ